MPWEREEEKTCRTCAVNSSASSTSVATPWEREEEKTCRTCAVNSSASSTSAATPWAKKGEAAKPRLT
eukprot:514495-Pelagomonas_calceolata.AAC.6